MIISTDYSYLRLAASPSDAMKEKHPEKRSWWVGPKGKIYDVGHDHNKFLEWHPEIFGDWADLDKALTMNWVRVAFFNGEYVVHCHSITRQQVAACQEIYKSLGGEHKIYIATLNKNGYISPHKFIWADSQTDLLKNLFEDPTGLRASGRRKAGSEDRAWLVSPQGEAYSCGSLHDSCWLNRKLLKAAQKIDPRVDESDVINLLMDEGWAKVGYFEDGGVAYLDANYFTGSIFRKFKELLSSWNVPDSTRVNVGDDVFSWRDFKFFDSMTDARKFMWHNRVGSSRCRTASEDRAWLISPQGQVINCGSSHEMFILDHRDFFRKMGYDIDSSYQMIKDGWTRVGLIGNILYLECNNFEEKHFNFLHDLTMKFDPPSGVQVIIGGRTMEFTTSEFKQFGNKNQVLRYLGVGKRLGSLPKSRNFLMGVSLDSMPWPLRQAFDLLNISEKKDKLSANQVVSVFQANDKFLQDSIGRTSTELIQELNGFFQYGPSKEQIA